jgi:hypothetical protein
MSDSVAFLEACVDRSRGPRGRNLPSRLGLCSILALALFSVGPASPLIADDRIETMKIEGTVTNLSVGKSAQVMFQVSTDQKDPTKVRAKGAYDNKNLVGKFDVQGRIVNQTEETTSMQFTGFLVLGGDESGFPDKTKVEYVMTLLFSGKEVKGVYRIAAMPEFGIDFEQHGTMDLKSNKRVEQGHP